MKVCSKCGAKKRSSGFYANTRTKDGLRSECKECSKLITKRLRLRKKGVRLHVIGKERESNFLEHLSEVVQLWEKLSLKMEWVAREAKYHQLDNLTDEVS